MRKLAIAFVVVVVLVGAVVFLRRGSRGAAGAVGEGVRQTTVDRGDLAVSVTATGRIIAREEASLSFDLPGRVVSVAVEVGDQVQVGKVLARLDDTTLALNVRQAQAALAGAQAQLDQLTAGPRREEVAVSQANLSAAQAALDGAQANRDDLEAGPVETELAAAEANVRAAEASLWLATIQRDELLNGASASEIAAAEAQVASALVQQKVARDAHDRTMTCTTVALPGGQEQEICPALGTIEEQARYQLYAADESVEAAQTQLDQLLAGPTLAQTDTGRANVAAAVAQRDAAQAQLELLRAGASAAQLEAAAANVATLAAQRDAAQAQLELLLAGASAQQIAVAQAAVDQAQVALEMAQAELDKVQLLAPFDGVVTAVNVQAGQVAPATLPAIAMADTSKLQIVVDVDEMDVARIREDQPVHITMDALPDQIISGHVERIAPTASETAGVVVYQVTIVLDETDVPLRIGMSATANIVIEEIADVLLVPNWAIRIDRDRGKTFVNVLQANVVEEKEITLGTRGEEMSEVLSGLEQGDVVVAGDVVGLRALLDQGE